MIRHHLTEDLLQGHAAGTLPEAFALVVAAHVSLCDDCRGRLMALEALGGAVLETTPPGEAAEALAPDALETCLARLGGQEARPSSPPRSTLPGALLPYIGGDLDAVKWRKLGMGVRQAILPTSARASARLLHIPGGQAVPDHGHRGRELTLVLRGAFRDETARFGPGDVEIAGEELNHQPVAEPGEDCICLAATDAALRFNAWVPRLLQPLFRI